MAYCHNVPFCVLRGPVNLVPTKNLLPMPPKHAGRNLILYQTRDMVRFCTSLHAPNAPCTLLHAAAACARLPRFARTLRHLNALVLLFSGTTGLIFLLLDSWFRHRVISHLYSFKRVFVTGSLSL
jgi:hypothetical protein